MAKHKQSEKRATPEDAPPETWFATHYGCTVCRWSGDFEDGVAHILIVDSHRAHSPNCLGRIYDEYEDPEEYAHHRFLPHKDSPQESEDMQSCALEDEFWGGM